MGLSGCDMLDGKYDPLEIQSDTGMNLKRCKEIIDIRNGVKEEWLK